jgi:hypothetical protein
MKITSELMTERSALVKHGGLLDCSARQQSALAYVACRSMS